MGRRINTILQACFFGISGVLPRDEAIEEIKKAIKKTYGKRGEAVVKKNFDAVDMALDYLFEVKVPDKVTSDFDILPPVPEDAPEFVREVLGKIIAREGDSLPVSALPNDGTYPTATTQYEKRNVTQEIPVWDEEQDDERSTRMRMSIRPGGLFCGNMKRRSSSSRRFRKKAMQVF